jgi:hypothetical protein
MSRRSGLVRSLAPLLSLLFVVGCVGKLGNTDRYTDAATCPDDFQRAILTPRCGLEGCHVPYEPTGGLDFVSPDLHLRLVNRTATTCGDRLLVNASAPGESFLLTRLSPNPTCGADTIDRMPLTGEYLTDAELACARAFVERLSAGDHAP